MLTTMVSGYYDANPTDVYAPATETYGEYCYGMQEICTQMPCGYHGPPGSVRMVNGSTGPMALPLQVPPGHLLQQVVDENGAVRHILYSPPMPMPVGAHYSPSHASTMATASAYYAYAQPPYAAAAPHYHPQPPSHLAPAMNHQSMHSIMQPPSPQCNGQSPQTGTSPPPSHVAPAQKDDRYQRQTYKFRRKLEGRSKDCNKMVILSNQATSLPLKKERRKLKYDDSIRLNGGSSGSNASEDEEMTMMLSEYLSSMRPPTVTDVSSRSAVVCWKPPEISASEVEKKLGLNPEQSEIAYEVMLCEKGKDGHLKSVYSGSGYHCTVTCLKPSTEYYVCIQASLDDVRGRAVEGPVFMSQGVEAEVPQPPRLCARTKNSLTVKWNISDTSTKIKSYSLEYDEGFGGHSFVTAYSGPLKQYKVTKLLPATCYRFRLCVEYEKGKRVYSSESAFFTCGNAPSQPLPPVLKQAYINKLHLEWEKRPCDNDFSLLFKDDNMHGFLTAYNGREASYVCTGLRGNTEYKFQLCARNEEGHSPWSKTVTYSTLPDKLSCRPGKPVPKGRIHASCFRVMWDAPKENKLSSITKYKLEVDRGCGFEAVYTGPNTEFFLENLLPGTVYKLKVACISSTGCISYSDVNSITTAAVHPGKCAAPRLQCKPESSFLCLEWAHPVDDGGSSVSEYEVAMTSPDNVTLQAYKGSETTCVINDLLPGRPYLFQVRAWNRIGAGDWSDSLEVVSGAGPPDAPRNFTAESSSPHSCLLSWDEPVNNGAAITSYQLQKNREESSEEDEVSFKELYEGLSCIYEAKGLDPATLYFFRVRAVNDAGPGTYSDIVSCRTLASVPGAVNSVSVTTTSNSLSLLWKEPPNHGSEITSYNVELDDYLYNTEANTTELCIEGLSSATLYRVRVQALNSIGEGPFSSPVEGLTLQSPPEPPLLECVLVSHNHLRLKWGEGKNTDLILYTLEMSNKTKSFVPIYHGPGLNFKVNRLQENTAYHFRICASSDSGQGPYSELYTFSTTRAPPPSLKAPKVTSVTDSSCLVEWTSTKQYTGYTYSYQLQLAVGGLCNAKVVYHGQEVRCHLTNLDPQTHYLVRVAAIRHYQDEDLIGAYSPTTAFLTSPPDTVNSPLLTAAPQTSSVSFSERRTFRERQLAAVMSAAFLLIGFLFTVVLEHTFSLSHLS